MVHYINHVLLADHIIQSLTHAITTHKKEMNKFIRRYKRRLTEKHYNMEIPSLVIVLHLLLG